MKKIFTILSVVVLFTTMSQAQFQSVQNGIWNDPQTWSANPAATALPDSNTSVIVNHIITISGSAVCKNLSINGKVYSGGNIHIYGDLFNNGELRDDPNHGSDYLTVTINGSIINDGLYISGTTNFEGNTSHHLQTLNGNTINFGSAFGRNSEVDFIIDGVAYISGNLLLGGSKMILPGGSTVLDTLVLNNGLIDGGVIECNNNVILGIGLNSTIGFSGVFSEQRHTFIKDAILEGYINFNGSSIDSTTVTTSLIGNIVNNGTIITGGSTSVEGTQLTKQYDTNNQTRIYLDYYWLINGTYTNGTRMWNVYNTDNTQWSIKVFFTDTKNYFNSGFFGIDNFGRYLLIFIVIFFTIGIMSYKYGLTSPLTISLATFLIIFFFDVVVNIIPAVVNISGNEVPYLLTFLSRLIFVIMVIKEVSK